MAEYSICEKYREANVYSWSDAQYYSDWFLYGIQGALGRDYPITMEVLDNINHKVNFNSNTIREDWIAGSYNEKIREISPNIPMIGGELL